MTSTTVLEIGRIGMGLFGGLALFLFGLEQMTDALKIVAGGSMRRVLELLTTNRFKAILAGVLVTVIIQSSSVTTVLVVGFISAGLMSLPQSIGVIMGANIGTTITAQIIAFKVTQFALIPVAVGFALLFLAKRKRLQQYGLMIMGLGLIFLGMQLMSDATEPLRVYPPFIDLMRRMDNPLLAICLSAVFTALVQSSSATTGIIIVLAGQGLITLETGIAMMFGANLGTCITAVLAALGKPREAVQAAMVHVLFNVLGILLWLGFIGQFAEVVRWISPEAPGLTGAAKLAVETPRQIANAHTIFNLANALIFIWFAGPLAWLVRRLVPEKPSAELERIQPKYLEDVLLKTPELALDRVRLELSRMGHYVTQMVRQSLPIVIHGTREDLERLAAMDDDVDVLYGGIITYLGQLSQQNLLQSQSEQLSDYMSVANSIESIGDMVETNLVEVGDQRLTQSIQVSQATEDILQALHSEVCWSVEQSLQALVANNAQLAAEVMAAKVEINKLVFDAERHLSNRLTAAAPNRLASYRLESEMIEYLKRVYYFAKRIAKVTTGTGFVFKQIDLRETLPVE